MSRIFDTFLAAALVGSIASGAVFLSLTLLIRRGETKATERILAALLSFFVSFSFLATVPINVDRSFSVWLISQLASNSSETLTEEDAEILAWAFFSPESGEISRRIQEQVAIGNLEIRDGDLVITDQGFVLVKAFQVFTAFFDLNPRYTTPASE